MDSDGAMIGEYDIPTPASGARCIVAMSDGRLFFTQYDVGMIGENLSVSSFFRITHTRRIARPRSCGKSDFSLNRRDRVFRPND